MSTAATDFLSTICSASPARARLRAFSLLFVGSFVWLMAALTAHPPSALPAFLQRLVLFTAHVFSLVEPGSVLPGFSETGRLLASAAGALGLQILRALFAPDIIRHGLVIAFPLFLAYRLAAAYLNDVFELRDPGTARRFIRQAAFGTRPFQIAIAGGSLSPEDAASPVVQIGGPGQVEVNLENVAVFEHVDGTPHIIPPGRHQHVEAFERLRDIVDLRDQMTRLNELTVVGRTRDGIRIAARDVRLMYSILRSPVELSPAPDRPPYTYQDAAVLALVYQNSTTSWTDVMIDLVREQLQRFIAAHTLGEVLAAVGAPEIQSRIIEDTSIQRQAEKLSPGPGLEFLKESLQAPVHEGKKGFVPRLNLTDLFFSPAHGFPARAARSGVQLHWIDVGTWALPNQIVAETQLEAWKISSENETRRQHLDSVVKDSRLEELLRLIREIPLSNGSLAKQEGKPVDEVSAGVLLAYLGLLRTARDSYVREGLDVPERIEKAIEALSKASEAYLRGSGRARVV